MRLLLHQQLHNHFGGVGNRGAGTEDGGNAGFVEEVIVLRGDDTTGGDHDIRTAEFLSSEAAIHDFVTYVTRVMVALPPLPKD